MITVSNDVTITAWITIAIAGVMNRRSIDNKIFMYNQ